MREKKKKAGLVKRILMVLAVAALVFAAVHITRRTVVGARIDSIICSVGTPDWIDVDIIPVDGDSRRGVCLESKVKDIVIHYVGNPMTTAAANRNWYTDSQSTVSSHFLVGLDGEIIMCVPLWEKSSASNDRNRDTISVEVCHPDESGRFSEITYQSLVKLTAWLCEKYDLGTDHVIRHYDVTGKICPKYFVEYEDAWEQFKKDVEAAIS